MHRPKKRALSSASSLKPCAAPSWITLPAMACSTRLRTPAPAWRCRGRCRPASADLTAWRAGTRAGGHGGRADQDSPCCGRRCLPRAAAGVARVQYRAELSAVVVRRVGDDKTADEAVAAVDAEVVLVAEHRHHDLACGLVLGALGRLGPAVTLDGPAPVAVDLAGARLRPAARAASDWRRSAPRSRPSSPASAGRIRRSRGCSTA